MVPPENESPRALLCFLALVVAICVSGAARSESRAPSLEQLELERLMDQATRVFDKPSLPMEEISADFRYRCLRTTGAAELCECLAEKRPYSLRFEHYVRITSRTKAEIGYPHLSNDARRLIDKVYEVRDACVGPQPRAPGDG